MVDNSEHYRRFLCCFGDYFGVNVKVVIVGVSMQVV